MTKYCSLLLCPLVLVACSAKQLTYESTDNHLRLSYPSSWTVEEFPPKGSIGDHAIRVARDLPKGARAALTIKFEKKVRLLSSEAIPWDEYIDNIRSTRMPNTNSLLTTVDQATKFKDFPAHIWKQSYEQYHIWTAGNLLVIDRTTDTLLISYEVFISAPAEREDAEKLFTATEPQFDAMLASIVSTETGGGANR